MLFLRIHRQTAPMHASGYGIVGNGRVAIKSRIARGMISRAACDPQCSTAALFRFCIRTITETVNDNDEARGFFQV